MDELDEVKHGTEEGPEEGPDMDSASDDPAKEKPDSGNAATPAPSKSEQPADPDETHARHGGWVSKEEWVAAGKLPEAWHDAKTHNIRAMFIGDLAKQKREIEDLKSTTREMAVHNQRLNAAHKRQLSELEVRLKAQRNDAIIEGDDAKADKLEAELNSVRQESRDIAQSEAAAKSAATAHPSERPIFQAWLKDNGWWNTDMVKRERALGISAIMSTTPEGKAMSEEVFLAEVSRRIRESDTPGNNGQQNKQPAAVESGKGRSSPGAGKKLTESDLTPGERKAMKGFIANDVMTKEQYLAEVAESRQQ